MKEKKIIEWTAEFTIPELVTLGLLLAFLVCLALWSWFYGTP